MSALSSPGLYVHLPFCPYLCPYCDFAKFAHEDAAADRYLTVLRAEMARAPALCARTLYLGGGTPNTYAPRTIFSLVHDLRRRFAIGDTSEATIEVNPDRDLCAGLEAYRSAGLNRLSIGVQSFVPGELRVLGRRHTPEDVVLAVRRARAAGFVNVSVDLMFGAPGQTVASWRASLDAALALEVEHISTYGLTVEPGTPYARWFESEPGAFGSADVQADLYGIAIDVLCAGGFEHYEISNFARPGFRSAHNANYWANGEYLGLGVGAASYLGGERRTTTRNVAAYEQAILAGSAAPAESEHLDGPARVGEAAMLALRTAEGVDLQSFAERYHVDFNDMFGSVIEELSAAGLIRLSSTHVSLTRRGRFLANDVCGAFVAAA